MKCFVSRKQLFLDMQKLAKYTFPVYLIVIIVLLILPTKDSGINIHFNLLGIPSDKVIHATMFIPFMIFTKQIFRETNFFIPFFLGVFFASFCESLHYFIPYRDFSIYDFYANMTGLILGSSAYLFRKKVNL